MSVYGGPHICNSGPTEGPFAAREVHKKHGGGRFEFPNISKEKLLNKALTTTLNLKHNSSKSDPPPDEFANACIKL